MSNDPETDHFELLTDANVREGRYDLELAEELQAAEDTRRRIQAEKKNYRFLLDSIRECGK